MRTEDNTNDTAVGLDVGTSRICLARRNGEGYEFDTQLNAFVTIPYSKMTLGVLERSAIPHNTNGNEITVHGNEADRFADLLNVETRRTMNKGFLDTEEPDSLRVLRQILAIMLPGKNKRKLCFTVPAPPVGAEGNLTYHEATIKRVLSDMGHDVRSINEGLAVIYSELESSNYTGIGISCGGGLCNFCLSYLSMPVVSFSIPKAGDYIDQSAAALTGDRINRVRIIKEESFHLNGMFEDKTFQVLSVYYDEMIQALVKAMKEAFQGAKNKPKFTRPIPLVLSGGTALPRGFRDRFEKILAAAEFPIALSEVRLAADPLHSTARGALVAAMTDM